jgi:hypothetical protein
VRLLEKHKLAGGVRKRKEGRVKSALYTPLPRARVPLLFIEVLIVVLRSRNPWMWKLAALDKTAESNIKNLCKGLGFAL